MDAYPGSRLVVEIEGQTEPIATPYVTGGWLFGAAASTVIVFNGLRRAAKLWVRWRAPLRGIPGIRGLFAGDWDERFLDPVAEYLAAQPELKSLGSVSPKTIAFETAKPDVHEALLLSHYPETILAAALLSDPEVPVSEIPRPNKASAFSVDQYWINLRQQRLEAAIDELLAKPSLTEAENRLLIQFQEELAHA